MSDDATFLIHADQPRPGWYRMRRHKGGAWLPVAIWRVGPNLVARVGDKMEDPLDIWTFCAGNSVSAEEAQFSFANAGRWRTAAA